MVQSKGFALILKLDIVQPSLHSDSARLVPTTFCNAHPRSTSVLRVLLNQCTTSFRRKNHASLTIDNSRDPLLKSRHSRTQHAYTTKTSKCLLINSFSYNRLYESVCIRNVSTCPRENLTQQEITLVNSGGNHTSRIVT